jgi:hypothetical protein
MESRKYRLRATNANPCRKYFKNQKTFLGVIYLISILLFMESEKVSQAAAIGKQQKIAVTACFL